MDLGITTSIGVTVGLMGLTVILLTSILASLYRKAGPHEALIVYGFRGTRDRQGARHGHLSDGRGVPASCRWS